MKALAIIPAYSHIDHRLMAALLDSQVPFLPLHGCSDLPKVRSQLITLALAQATERVLFIDADVVPRAEQLRELADSPLVTGEQALTGLYPIRDVRATAAGGRGWSVDAVDPERADAAAEFDANWAGLGFCAIHTESLRRVGDTLPLIRWPEMDWRPYCVPLVEGGQYYPDDRVLWHRLRLTGTRLVASNALRVGHVAGVVLREVV